MILNQMKDLKLSIFKTMYETIQEKNQDQEFPDKTGLIFVNGSYCQGKRKFAENLIRYQRDFGLQLHLLRFPLSQYPVLDKKLFLQSLVALSR